MRVTHAKRLFKDDAAPEPLLDSTRVRMNKPAWFIRTTLASGVIIKESLEYYATYELADKAARAGSYIPNPDPLESRVQARIEAELRTQR